MAWNHDVDVLDCRQRFRERLRKLHAAGALSAIDDRRIAPREHVARLQHAHRRKDDERVAVGVSGAEVIEINAIVAAADRQLVLEGPLRQERRVRALERRHLRHVGFGVFLSDDVDAPRKSFVAADVIAVRVRVDDCRDRLVGDLLHLLENHRSVPRELRVDEDDAGVGDEDDGVAAGEVVTRRRRPDHVQVVFDLDGVRQRRAHRPELLRYANRQSAERDERRQYDRSCHASLREPATIGAGDDPLQPCV